MTSQTCSLLLMAIISTICLVEAGQQVATPNTQDVKQLDVSKNLIVNKASQLDSQPAPISSSSTIKRAANAEKLKRGLNNFMNHQLNPANFFVPAHVGGPSNGQLSGEAKPLATKTSAGSNSQLAPEPAAIVSGESAGDALIKGPNRLRQTRPIGGPLRWGRR